MDVTYETPQDLQERTAASRPRRAEGVELYGAYDRSAYRDGRYLVRRGDGQVIQLSRLLYLVVSGLDGQQGLDEVAQRVSEDSGSRLHAEHVDYLVTQKLRPLGLIADPSAPSDRRLPRANPLLALRYRKGFIPAHLHRSVTIALRPLFRPPVVLLTLAALIGFNVWIAVGLHGAVTGAFKQVLFHPGLFLAVTGIIIFSGIFHELGHATGARYGGGSPGAMGAGLYLIWPVFFTDLTDVYRLDRRSRLRADLGGIYFNAILAVAAGAAYMATGFGPLLVFILTSEAEVLYQFLPFVRLDGYYVVGDLIGIPNPFALIGPVLAQLLHKADEATRARLRSLNRPARIAITAWAILTVAFLLFNFGFVAVLAPVLVPAEAAQARIQVHGMLADFGHHATVSGINDLVDLAFFILAPLGMLFLATLMLRRAGRAVIRWWPRRRLAALILATVTLATVSIQGSALVANTAHSLTPSPAAGRTATPDSPPSLHHQAPVPPAPAVPSSPAPRPQAPPTTAPTAPAATPSTTPATLVYVVQPHDTLWAIAGRYLANPAEWTQLYTLNRGLPQPNGGSLTNPGRIYPGWHLRVPAPTVHSAPAPGPVSSHPAAATTGGPPTDHGP